MNGLVALVTGTGQGIGAAIADALADAGATVHRADRDTVDLSVRAESRTWWPASAGSTCWSTAPAASSVRRTPRWRT